MKTAEEILKEYGIIICTCESCNSVNETHIKAMESYASQFKSPYPKMMYVWDNDDVHHEYKMLVLCEYDDKFWAVDNSNSYGLSKWLHAKDI